MHVPMKDLCECLTRSSPCWRKHRGDLTINPKHLHQKLCNWRWARSRFCHRNPGRLECVDADRGSFVSYGCRDRYLGDIAVLRWSAVLFMVLCADTRTVNALDAESRNQEFGVMLRQSSVGEGSPAQRARDASVTKRKKVQSQGLASPSSHAGAERSGR